MNDRKKGYESEIRIHIKNIEDFKNKLEDLNSRIIKKYKFIDEIYTPIGAIDWDHQRKVVRIRKYSDETNCRILFSHIDFIKHQGFRFKRSKYPGGKLDLFKGEKTLARKILKDLGFRYFFSIEKSDGKLIKIPLKDSQIDFIIALEEIRGWRKERKKPKCDVYLAEIEVWTKTLSDIIKIFNDRLEYLDISKEDVISDTVPFYISKICEFH
ncbi:MAG: hypothetical protein GF329_07900 [Candidatus Lokiarchaeota archaeon]|nr:hypothetical protein [Candidatus Lokiarchaeota archaeon]